MFFFIFGFPLRSLPLNSTYSEHLHSNSYLTPIGFSIMNSGICLCYFWAPFSIWVVEFFNSGGKRTKKTNKQKQKVVWHDWVVDLAPPNEKPPPPPLDDDLTNPATTPATPTAPSPIAEPESTSFALQQVKLSATTKKRCT